MRILFLILVLVVSICNIVQCQNKTTDSSKLVGGVLVDSTAPNFKYLRWNGSTLVDIRNMTEKEKVALEKETRIRSLESDHRFSDIRFDYGHSANISIAYEQPVKDTLFSKYARSGISFIQAQTYVEFAAINIKPEQVANYRFHVILNDQKEIVPWSIPQRILTTKDGKYKYVYLGKYGPIPDGFLKIELYNVNNYADKGSFIVDWRKISPYVFSGLFIKYTIKGQSSIFTGMLNISNVTRKFTPFIETKKDDYRVRMGDSIVELEFNDMNRNNFTTYQTSVVKDNRKIYTGICDNNRVNIPYKVWNEPGKYTVTMTPRMSTIYWEGQTSQQMGRDILMHNLATSFSFTVLPPLHQKFSFSRTQIVLFLSGVLLAILLVWFFVRQRATLKIANANFQKEKNLLELSALRSQLNPHFVFNAIAGIQNLILKNNTEAAATYLGKLGKITRNVLDGSQKELVSIGDEMHMLREYMEMEQLRFGFQFDLLLDDTIQSDVEIPAMLLQPLVENVVKHGISGKKGEGKIVVRFEKINKDLVVRVKDNGGIATDFSNENGYGIRIVKKRIALINEAQKEKILELKLQSDSRETQASVILHKWI